MSGTMTPLERLLAIVQGKKPDYIPTFPMLNEYAAKLMKIPELEYYRHPERLAEGQTALVNKFGHDFVLAFTYLAREAASLGSSIHFSEEAAPTIGGLLIKDPRDVASLDIPDFFSNPQTRVVLEQIEKLKNTLGSTYPIVGAATGPFSWPTLIMGNDQWLTSLFMEEPETIKAVINHAKKFAIAWANAQVKAGCHVIALVEGSATKSVIPEDIFKQYVKPTLAETSAAIKAPIMLLGVGGEFEPYLPDITTTGVAGVVISTDDELSSSLAKAGNLIIAGNVNNLEFMDYTVEDIDRITSESMAVGKGKRFIYSTQYVLPNMVQDFQIAQFVSSARKYGQS